MENSPIISVNANTTAKPDPSLTPILKLEKFI
jgi:hypothetical protein